MEFILLLAFTAGVTAAVFMLRQNLQIPTNLGVSNGRLSPLPASPNGVSSQADTPEKKVEPLPFRGDLQAAKAALRQALETYGGIRIFREEERYIHAVATTGTMRFRDDLEFYFDAEAGVVHFRSASRVGYSDLGLNRKRFARLKELYLAAR